jgi:hypothetical protein
MASGATAVPSGDLRAVVKYIHANLSLVEAQRHPLGFLHIDARSLHPREREVLRLHLWCKEFMTPDGIGQHHDHAWTLTSVVLHGQLTDTIFGEDIDPSGEHRLLNVQYGESEDKLEVGPDRFTLRPFEERRVNAGHIYRLEAGVVHETTVQAIPTSTLVLASFRDEHRPPRVFTPLSKQSGEVLVSTRQAVEEHQVAGALDALLDAMAESTESD